MIVVDASALFDALLPTHGTNVPTRIFDFEDALHAPHLLDLEIAHVLRRYERTGRASAERCRAALADLGEFPLIRHPHEIFLGRIWELRHSLTTYDAAYVALAEALDAPLLTRDQRLAVTRGHHARIELV
jgi:predicted nucleic acid-binding protein